MAQSRLLVLDDDITVGQILVIGAQAAGMESRLCEEVDDFHHVVGTWAPTHVAIDLTLPGSSGIEVLQRLAASGCDARVLICSGGGADELRAALVEAERLGLKTAGVLPKPFRLAQLRALLAG